MRTRPPRPAAARLVRVLGFALLAGMLVVASACGGGGDNGDEVATEPPPAPTTTETEAPAGSKFTSRQFRPRFTIELPGGWQAVEEPAMTQFYSGETSQRVVTISSRLAGTSVSDAVARMRRAPNLQAAAPTETTVGGSEGQVFGASVDSGYSTDIPGVAYEVIDGFEVRVWTLNAAGQTVVVIADAPAAEAEAFFTEVEGVLATLAFGPGG
jgi:hypothetical protein